MSSDSQGIATLVTSRCAIYITDENSMAGLVFPVDPIVISLKKYDSVGIPGENPMNGYPLVCITVRVSLSLLDTPYLQRGWYSYYFMSFSSLAMRDTQSTAAPKLYVTMKE